MRVLAESFDVHSKNGAFYLGGKLHWSQDGTTLLCPANDVVNILDVDSGGVRGKIGEQDAGDASDAILCYTADVSCQTVVTAHRSGLLKQWDVTENVLVKSWKSIHRGPIAQLSLTLQVLASGGTDGLVRLWDLEKNSCTHVLRGSQGVISVLEFFKQRVFACGDELKIKSWDQKTGETILELAGHYSKVTGLAFSESDNIVISCGRDKVLICWDLNTGENLKTIPVYETLESVFIYPSDIEIPHLGDRSGLFVATAGDRGAVRVFDCRTGSEVFKQSGSNVTEAKDGGLAVVQLLLNHEKKQCAVVTVDHNIILHNLKDFSCYKQFVGFLDEVLDVAFMGPNHNYLAIATNSADIKLYNLGSQNCQILRGHTDFVLSIAVSTHNPCLLVSGGKDGLVCLWELLPKADTVHLILTSTSHTAAVNSVCFYNLSGQYISCSSDTTLKIWKNDGNVGVVVATEVAHSKDINCVTVSPNDKLVATASQDKTIKVWQLPGLILLGTLTGHRRGVWCVRFSPIDQIVVSCSADCTMKIWNLLNLSCLQTFEGHESSVMKAAFLSDGLQIVSCSGDGLLKLWTVNSGECTATFEGHDGKIWALDVNEKDGQLVTAGTDSQFIIWRNTTEEKRTAELEARNKMLEKDQELSNLLRAGKLLDALKLALWLDRPYKTLTIIKNVMIENRVEELTDAVKNLSDDGKEKLLECAAIWNCNAKHCAQAQLVLSILLHEIATGSLTIKNMHGFIRDSLSYTDRHFRRLTQSLQSLQLLNYTLKKINPALV